MNHSNSTPLISIIVPIYNRENTLERCVKSVLEQTYSNFELILVNDGSSDASEKICKKYNKENVKYIYQPNSGVSVARNAGLRMSEGDYLLFLDSDDWIERTALAQMIEPALLGAEIVMCEYENIYINDRPNHTTSYNVPVNKIIREYDYKKLVLKEVLAGNLSGCGNKLFSRHLLDGHFMDETLDYGEDLLFQLEVFNRAKSLFYIDSGLYKYTHESTTSLTNKKREFCYKEVYKKIYDENSKYAEMWSLGKFDILVNLVTYTTNNLVSSFNGDYKTLFYNCSFVSADPIFYNEVYPNIHKFESLTKFQRLVIYLLKYKMQTVLYVVLKFRLFLV